jgi:hypothetical protein
MWLVPHAWAPCKYRAMGASTVEVSVDKVGQEHRGGCNAPGPSARWRGYPCAQRSTSEVIGCAPASCDVPYHALRSRGRKRAFPFAFEPWAQWPIAKPQPRPGLWRGVQDQGVEGWSWGLSMRWRTRRQGMIRYTQPQSWDGSMVGVRAASVLPSLAQPVFHRSTDGSRDWSRIVPLGDLFPTEPRAPALEGLAARYKPIKYSCRRW